MLGAFLCSELADGITFIVVPLAVYAVSNDLIALAGTFLGRLLLASAVAVAGGAVADRWERRRTLLVTYGVRAVLVVSLMLVPSDEVTVFALVGVLLGASGAFDNPSAEASLRAVYRHDLQSLAAARKTGKTLSSLVGPALGGLFVGIGGMNFALGVNIVMFVLAWLILVGDVRHQVHRERQTADSLVRRMDWGVLRRAPRDLKLAFFSTLVASFLVGLSTVVAVPYLDHLERAPSGSYGYAIAAYSAGALCGLWLAGITTWERVSLRVMLSIANGVYGLLVVLSVAAPSWELLAVAWFLWGLAFGPEDVVADARVAALVPDDRLGRLYAWWSIIARLGSALAFGSAMLLGSLDERAALLLTGLAYAVVVPLLVLLLGGRRKREVKAQNR